MAAKTIKEINNKYSYTDENPGGKTDASLVSCAQCENYNELQYIYNEKLKPYIDENNPYGSIAKLLRQAAIEKATKIHNSKAEDDQKIKATKVVESSYSKTDRILILELGRIGNNINQIAKAINTDIASTGAFDKLKLLHLLISIDQQLRELRPDDR